MGNQPRAGCSCLPIPLSSIQGLQPEIQPGPEAAKLVGIEHVVDWQEIDHFFSSQAHQAERLYYANDPTRFDELPPAFLNDSAPSAPLWVQSILRRWPAFEGKEVGGKVTALMAVQSKNEIAESRFAAKATVISLMAGMHAIRPGLSQRSVEAIVESACWNAGARGPSFWPWVMAGENAVFPHPFTSLARYDHLNRIMRAGELVRLDVGCEWDHQQGDLGRTVPVSGHYNDEQRETWTIFVAAYHAGVTALRAGVTVDEVFDAWRNELLRHRSSAKTNLGQQAINFWSDRKNVPFWQIHTTNLLAGLPS